MQRLHTLGLSLVLGTALGTPAVAQTANAATSATAAPADQTPLPAKTLIDQAVKTAKASHKNVFLYFTASWCGWCHRLGEALNSPEIGPVINAHYVVLPLTVTDKASRNNPGSDSVVKALGLKTDGMPVYAFLDGNGHEMASSQVMPPDNHGIGYPGLPEEVNAFEELLKKTAPGMTAAERTKVTDYLNHWYDVNIKNASKQVKMTSGSQQTPGTEKR